MNPGHRACVPGVCPNARRNTSEGAPRTALTPLILMPVLAWLLFRALREPALPSPSGATEADGPAPSPTPQDFRVLPASRVGGKNSRTQVRSQHAPVSRSSRQVVKR